MVGAIIAGITLLIAFGFVMATLEIDAEQKKREKELAYERELQMRGHDEK